MTLGRKKAFEDRRGVAAIEFAMVAPLFILMMMGIIVYGTWFWLSHSVQSLASESARSAIAGLDATERTSLARNLVASQSQSLGLDPSLTTTNVITNGGMFEIEVIYDASTHPIRNLAILMPKPPALIRRTAAVKLEDY